MFMVLSNPPKRSDSILNPRNGNYSLAFWHDNIHLILSLSFSHNTIMHRISIHLPFLGSTFSFAYCRVAVAVYHVFTQRNAAFVSGKKKNRRKN